MKFGSWTEGMDANPALLDVTEEKLDTPLEIASVFRGPDDEWPYPADKELGKNRTLLVSWHLGEVACFSDVTHGMYDDFITQQAIRLKEYRHPVVIRPWAEMNADWVNFQPTNPTASPKDQGGTYDEFIEAWRHTVDITRKVGATTVGWAFNPTTDTYKETTPIEAIYPGDDYVDYLALDGYNWGDGDGLSWRSFDDIYSEQYTRLTALAPEKPIWLAEIGSSDPRSRSSAEKNIRAPRHADKGVWWNDALHAMKTDFPNIEATVFFDAEKERDWRVDSSHTALRGLRRAIARYH